MEAGRCEEPTYGITEAEGRSMKMTMRQVKKIVEVAMTGDAEEYYDALERQLEAERTGDGMEAERWGRRAATLFFVMEPREQTQVSREARRRGLA